MPGLEDILGRAAEADQATVATVEGGDDMALIDALVAERPEMGDAEFAAGSAEEVNRYAEQVARVLSAVASTREEELFPTLDGRKRA